MSGSGGRHSRWTLTHTRCSGTTSTSSTHSDVQMHIPPVGSWSWVRICEICQPMGDWVIEEFDSERNILLPWWWTRGNNTRIQQHWGLAGEKREDWSLIEATKETTTESSVKGLSGISELTSTGVILHQKLIQGHPASAHAHHHSAAQNSHQTQLLGVSKLWRRGGACEIWGSALCQCQGKKK